MLACYLAAFEVAPWPVYADSTKILAWSLEEYGVLASVYLVCVYVCVCEAHTEAQRLLQFACRSWLFVEHRKLCKAIYDPQALRPHRGSGGCTVIHCYP